MFIDRAIFRFMPESGARTAAIKTGEVLINETTDGPTAKQLAGDPNVQVLKLLPFALQIAKFNHSQAPCDDVNFRRAVTACINAEETMEIAFPDIHKLDGGLVYGYSPYYTKAGTELYNQNNQAKAKEFLAKSKYKGETLTFIVDNTRPPTDTATDLKEQLGQIDIKVADWPTISTLGFKPEGWHFWTHGLGIEPYEGPAKLMSIWANGISQTKDDPNNRQAVRRSAGGAGYGETQGDLRAVPAIHVRQRRGHSTGQLRHVPGGVVEGQELRALSHPTSMGDVAGGMTRRATR